MNPSTRLCRHCLARVQPKASTISSLRGSFGSSQSRRSIQTKPIASSKPKTSESQTLTRTTSRQISFDSSTQQAQTNKPNDAFVTTLGHTSPDTNRELLKKDNLFHSFSRSPSPEVRARGARIQQQAYCPHPSHVRTRNVVSPSDPEGRKPLPGSPEAQNASPPAHVQFECPDCGIPVSCCKEHWEDDYEAHLEICDTLRTINEDDHDIRSGRFFPETNFPGHQRAEEFMLNMSNWDTFFYTRDFPAMDDMRSMRHVTRLMTYPVTVASVLHELSPYNIRADGRLTPEGLRSFSALRYTLHPPRQGEDETMKGLKPKPPPIRIFILGARGESSLPREVWYQLVYCFPRATFHIIFIGPESMMNRDDEFPLPERTPSNPFGGVVEDRIGAGMKITTYVDFFQTMHQAQSFVPYDPYFDVFMLFHPGLGYAHTSHEWEEVLPQLLETKCPVICTGYTGWDMQRDIDWVKKKAAGEVDILLEPGENIYRSLRWEMNDHDPNDLWCPNWGVWSFRGKRYETTQKGS